MEKDQAIAEVDSDKATLELPAEESGIITLKAEVGDAVGVGEVVCLIDTSASKPDAPAKEENAARESKPEKEVAVVEKSQNVITSYSIHYTKLYEERRHL